MSKLLFLFVATMSVKDYIKCNSHTNEFGIEGYKMTGTTALDKPVVFKLSTGPKKTYIDDAVKSKKGIPSANYNVMGDLVNKGKSDIERDIRRT